MSKEPHTWEAHYAARQASSEHPGVPYNVEENLRRLAEIKAQYFADRQEWIRKSGRSLPSREAIRKWRMEGGR